MLLLPIILTLASFALAGHFEVVHDWRYIDYLWKWKGQKKAAISGHRFDSERIFIIDAHKVSDGRVFVTTPPYYRNAVPASLSIVSAKRGPGGPLLEPYPSWEWYNLTDCNSIIGVWRIAVDACDRLWVMDGGKVGDEQMCKPKLLTFDLKTDKLLQRLDIPDEISQSPRNQSSGRLSYLAVETNGNKCDQTWIYIADFGGGGLVVTDGSKIRRFDDDVFHPGPRTAAVTIAGETIPNALNGPFGLALTPEISSHSPRLFLRGLTSKQQNSVLVKDLQKSAKWDEDICSTASKYRFPGPLGAQAFSRDGIMFFGMTEQMAVGCWNIRSPLNAEHVDIVAQDDETLQWIGGLKIVKCSDEPFREEVWVATNRLQKVILRTMNFDETNFRILRASVDTLVKGCKCDLRGDGKSSAL